MASSKTLHKKTTLDEALKSRAKIPASWERAFGILKGRKPDALEELKKMRREWAAYSKKVRKPLRHAAR